MDLPPTRVMSAIAVYNSYEPLPLDLSSVPWRGLGSFTPRPLCHLWQFPGQHRGPTL